MISLKFILKKMNKEKIWKFIKFCFVGGTSALVGFIIFNIFFWIGLKFYICVIISMLLSTIYNFVLNRNLTFKSKKVSIKKQIGKYGVVYFLAQATNFLVSILMKDLLGEGVLQANISVLAGLVVSIPISFFGSLLWVFKNKTKHLNT